MKTRSSIPFFVTVLVLVALPIVELWLLVQVGRAIGVWWTLLILLAEALFGAWLTKREGRAAWRALNTSVAAGRMPARELTDAALVLVGGVLLIFPGFVTDVLGLICLLPFTRPLARWVLGLVLARRLVRFEQTLIDPRGRPGDVIEGEIVPETSGRPEPVVIRGELDDSPTRSTP